jgi:ABC-2 type transport system permease protein
MIIRGRIGALIVKELLTLLRDPSGRFLLIGPPLLQLFIFAFAATLEVKNVSLILYNQDQGSHGYELTQRLAGSPTFNKILLVNNESQITPALDEQKAIAVISIPQDFSRNIEAGNQAKIEIILDGRRSNAAQIVNGYLSQIISTYEQEVRSFRTSLPPIVVVVERNWFNENLLYMWFTVPSLVGILASLIALMVTSLSVARERELGTFDQLLVSPLMPYEILIGKTVPAIMVGLGEGLLIFFAARLFFGIPFTGSFLLLSFAIFIFVLSMVGVGLFISSISKTQQQAILGAFIFLVPVTALSGYAAPVDNMPSWLQKVVAINPLKHFLITVKGLFLKDMGYADVWSNSWPLLIISTFTLVLAGWFFTRRLE